MPSLLIKNGRVICPEQGIDDYLNVFIQNGVIASLCKTAPESGADEVIDASGLIVSPGLIDMHVHLRDPGFTHKEDILSGCEAAAAGGVTLVASMPNTNPAADSPETIEYILNKAKNAKAKVCPVACITHGLKGEDLTDFAALKRAGAVAVSDDGRPVKNALTMLRALKSAKENGLAIISHCEDMDIIGNGIINAGRVSDKLGVPGMHRSSEDSITAREIALAQSIGASIHIAHVSTKGSAAIIRSARKRGVKVTCETCPHYFTFTEDELLKRDADYRMNPPLREREDVEAIAEAVLDGTIDAIVTDHAPHAESEKADFLRAPNGVVGLETSLAAALTQLYHKRGMPLADVLRLMTSSPAKILGVTAGALKPGFPADVTMFDPDEEWTVDEKLLHSKSKNSVFKGTALKGRVMRTILNGKTVFMR